MATATAIAVPAGVYPRQDINITDPITLPTTLPTTPIGSTPIESTASIPLTPLPPVTPVPTPGSVSRLGAVSEGVTPHQLIFAAEAANCNIIQCAGVLASAGCIARGVITLDPSGVLDCVSGGSDALCPCVACINALDGFLKSHGVCKDK
ncbi:uncharacterized protein K452DRAFT_285584 [Aplosporella prunicola CBS 121167]|uniref:Uncharacterized protein n=1 Tax=Aplosporella prunicola CBS 121167 TaxID=1176127 RepID=A0A6A6BJL2_9PEZI|nr:uncharacterized protein K452DRAFT_285584 [Aplosporella prunicola CBS 121167]KAF2144350.1 hypothetical protein K452DRAFT_285584 [Aplosporella prunicola CBS 121167]